MPGGSSHDRRFSKREQKRRRAQNSNEPPHPDIFLPVPEFPLPQPEDSPARRFRRFGIAGLAILIAAVIFFWQYYQSMVGTPPSWVAASVCLTFTASLILVAIWFYDRSADLHLVIRCLLTSLVIGGAILYGYSPIKRQRAFEHASRPEQLPVTKSDFTHLEDWVKQHGSVGDSASEKYPNETLPGWTAEMLIRINSIGLGRRNYFLDVGSDKSTRMSAYISPQGTFVASLMDERGELHTLDIPLGPSGIPMRAVFSLGIEFGSGNQHTIVRVRVNAKEVGLLDLPYVIDITLLKNLWYCSTVVFGSDLDVKNGGMFDAFEFRAFGNTLTATEAQQELLYLQQRLTQPVYLRFTGTQGAVKNKNNSNMEILGDKPVWVNPRN